MYSGDIIDSHMHLWDLVNNYPWLVTDVPVLVNLGGNYDKLKRNFLVEDYLALTKKQKVIKSVHVEAFGFKGDPILETHWLQKQADQYGFPQGIVARAELHDPEVETILKEHCQYPNVRGIRMVLNYAENPTMQMADRRDYLRDKQWRKGFALLAKYELLFDLQIFDEQIEDAISLISVYPDIKVVIEHFAWPLVISDDAFDTWKQRMAAISQYPNVFIKLSAIGWVFKNTDFNLLKKYVTEAIKLFGIHRCMFGSNFPPDSLFYNFADLINTFKKILSTYSDDEQRQFFCENARKIYRLL